jgi:NAD-specific glutamate dehydrogenase
LSVAHHVLHNNNKRHEGGITTKEYSKKRQYHYIHTYIHTYIQEREKKIQSFIPSLQEYLHEEEEGEEISD